MSDHTNAPNGAKAQFDLSQNPLVNPPAIPYGAPALDIIEDAHFEPALIWALDKAKANIDAIVNNTDAPTFENTIEALAFASEELSRVSLAFDNISLVNDSDILSDVEERIIAGDVTEFETTLYFNQDLFQRVKAVYDDKDNLTLTTEQRVLLENTFRAFESKGANLPQAQQDEFLDIQKKLSTTTQKYKNNALKHRDAYEKLIDDEALLDGVPDLIKQSLAQEAKKNGHDGKWLIKLNPTGTSVITYADDRALRQELFEALDRVGNEDPYDNKPLIVEILNLRQRAAELLGYAHHGDYVTSDRMAKSADTVLDFLAKNKAAYHDKAEEEFETVKNYALATGEISTFEPWDRGYYTQKYKKDAFDYDPQELRKYFKLENVVDGLFQHAEKLFNVSFTDANDTYPRYDESMNAYEVHDKDSGDFLGVFYTDYFARDGKSSGAWKHVFRDRSDYQGQNMPAIVINCCNYPEPTDDTPTLLTFREVETAFHEFGHALHALLGQGRFPSITGTNVKRDFVEFPSQIQENWAGEKEVLDTFARHYQDDTPLPQDLLDKSKEAGAFGKATMGFGQTRLGLFDMVLHTSGEIASVDELIDIANNIQAQTSFFPTDLKDPNLMISTFGHLFSDPLHYSAAYYGYKWAEVLDADGFTAFTENGLYDRASADALKVIYQSGGTVPPDELYRNFMGRDPDPDALYIREGVKDDPDSTPSAHNTPPKPQP